MQMEAMQDSSGCLTGAGEAAPRLVDGGDIMEINGDGSPQTLGWAHRGVVEPPS